MKKMNEGLIDLKNQKNNGNIFMNIETNSGLDMQQQSFQWDAADKDAAKGANMKYQA